MTIKNQELITKIEQEYINNNVPQIKVGDTIRLGIKIQEGQKIRTQYYEGVIISKKNSGLNKTITVRRIMQGIGIERCLLCLLILSFYFILILQFFLFNL